MATHDYVIANGTGAAVRSDLNDALAAIVSNNSSSSEPATTYAYQWWADTTANVLKIRNSANNAWITLRELDGTMLIEDGSASTPGLAFADDTNTGIFSGGADEINIATGGTERVVVNSSGKVGVGSAAPDAILEVGGVATSGETEAFAIERSDGVDLYRINYDPSTNSMEFQANNKEFAFQNLSSFGESLRIDDNGRLGVGLSSPQASLHVGSSGVVADPGPSYDVSGDFAGAVINSWNRSSAYNYRSTTDIIAWSDKQASARPSEMRFFTAPDSANATPQERMSLTSEGDLLIGTTDDNFASGRGLKIAHADGARIKLCDTDTGVGTNDGFEFAFSGTDAFIENRETGNLIVTTSNTERLRIVASGDLLWGSTVGVSNTQQGIQFSNVSHPHIRISGGTDTASRYRMEFLNGNGTVGTIVTNGSATAYNTSSDYRLKENVVDIADGITRVKQLQPRRFNFIAEPQTTVDGFIAHEAQTVVPEAVTGTHNEVDDDGNAVMQQIDKSKLVPLLTAALQEAIAKIETLETKVAALEAG